MSRPLKLDPIEEARRQWAERWPAAPHASMAAVTSVMRAQQVLLAHLNDALRPFGLTFPRYEALMLLLFTRAGALPLGKVGERLQVHRTSVTNIVDKLERDGLVERVPHAEDRRATLAEITAGGAPRRARRDQGHARDRLRPRRAGRRAGRRADRAAAQPADRRGRLRRIVGRPTILQP